ncbi:hypothetical protein INT43_003496 [Umbelopsis isabellina]|uniref:DUF676 domain-containing protein n=1 Tax=Mortierella isabellina TaxID=91625 RepID=A0A8H7PQW5_MORIS|nr:hypothetical protein INT43_003496 [Umbelopsis isabellina]
MAESKDKVHLFVLQHGLWGNKNHLNYIMKQLQQTYKDKIHTLNVAVNEAKYTYDGVDICGKRLADKIKAEVKELEAKGKTVDNISLLGYSLGGLISRYAIGILGEEGFFDKHKPVNFTTFATPHLGIYNPKPNPFVRLVNWASAYILARSGEQMRMVDNFRDGKPLLEVMASPDYEFYKHLARFERRLIYANGVNDRSVPFWTAAFEETHYFAKIKSLDVEYDPGFNSVVTSFDLRDPSIKYVPPKKPFTKWTILKYPLFALIPVLLPVWIVVALSVVSTQGLLSRLRVAKLISKEKTKMIEASKVLTNNEDSNGSRATSPTITAESVDKDSDSNRDRRQSISKFMDDNVLVPALEGVNFPGTQEEHRVSRSSQDSIAIDIAPDSVTFNVRPGTKIAKEYKPLKLLPSQQAAARNLNTLSWHKVILVLDSFNAHGAIIIREKRFDSPEAQAEFSSVDNKT